MTEKEERIESLIGYSVADYLAQLKGLIQYGKITANDNAEVLNLIVKLTTIISNYLKGNVGYETAIEFFAEIQKKINDILKRSV